MIVFAALTPHSPLLLDSINKNKRQHVTKTIDAMKELADELYASHPDTIVLISEHPTSFADAFSINLADPFRFDLSSFGDLGFERTFRPEIMLIDRLQRSLRQKKIPFTLTSDSALHYASAVPLHYLAERLPNVKLLPITYSDLSAKEHYQFGQALKDELMESNKRIAVIASGDMSHALNNDAPAGFDKSGPEYDQDIQEIIAQKSASALINMDPEFIEDAHQTSYKPLLILFGLIERLHTKTEILSYEAPFGVGYLTANFVMK